MATSLDDSESTSLPLISDADSTSNRRVNSSADTVTPATADMTNDATESPSFSTSPDAAVTSTDRFPAAQASAIDEPTDRAVSEETQPDAGQLTNTHSDTPVLSHVFVGLDGSPIARIEYRFESDGEVVAGRTDENGNAKPVTSFSAGSDCTVSVLTDSGAYKQLACYTVPTADTTATLMSGSMVVGSESQKHGGSPENVANEPSVPAIEDGSTKTHSAYSPQDLSETGDKSFYSSSSTDGNSQSVGSAASGTHAAKSASGNSVRAASAKPTAKPSQSTTQSQPHSGVKLKGGSGNPVTPTTMTLSRDEFGHPQASLVAAMTDWTSHQVHAVWHYIEDLFGLESNPVAGKAILPSTSSSIGGNSGTNIAASQTLAAVKNLVLVAEGQAEHTMASSATVINIKQIADGSITYGSKPSKKSKGQCYMYVKIALWRAGAIKFLKNKKGDFDAAGGSYAKVAGEFLTSQGFENITSQLPDARWALPGDVIVYHVKGDTETADGHGQPGHIDIRTYHYYVSDFKRNYLCFSGGAGTHFYEVIGIYRKPGFSDSLALARMKAFLKVIRSREAKAFFSIGDDKTYHASQGIYRFQEGIQDFSTYPAGANHQGAYQVSRASWTSGHAMAMGALPRDFSPQTQDRYAVWLMEGEPGRFGPKPDYPPVPTALGYIRQGAIEQAVNLLRARQWPSLPGGNQDQGYTLNEMKADFSKYLKEYGG